MNVTLPSIESFVARKILIVDWSFVCNLTNYFDVNVSLFSSAYSVFSSSCNWIIMNIITSKCKSFSIQFQTNKQVSELYCYFYRIFSLLFHWNFVFNYLLISIWNASRIVAIPIITILLLNISLVLFVKYIFYWMNDNLTMWINWFHCLLVPHSVQCVRVCVCAGAITSSLRFRVNEIKFATIMLDHCH